MNSSLETTPNTWNSSYYVGRGINGTFVATLPEGSTLATVRITYSRESQYKAGQTVSFDLQLTRSKSLCYGLSTNTFGQRLLVVVPLSGPHFEGTYQSNIPIDHGTMQFEGALIEQILSQVPRERGFTKPILPEPTCCEMSAFCCSVACSIQ